MAKPSLFQAPGKLTAVSLTLPANLPQAEWIKVGLALGRLQAATQWFNGDWWAFGEHRYGDRKAVVDANDWQGPSFQACMNAASVCRAFATSRRREALSFGHHAEVAALPAPEADALLDWVEAGIPETGKPRSIRDLREERDRRTNRLEPISLRYEEGTVRHLAVEVRYTEGEVRRLDYRVPEKPSADVVVIEGGRSDDDAARQSRKDALVAEIAALDDKRVEEIVARRLFDGTKDETMHARWQVSDDADSTRLHVTLWNNCSLTLVAPSDGSTPWVRLSSEGGDFELDQTSQQAFRRWLDAAQGRR